MMEKSSPCFVVFIAIDWRLQCIYPDPDPEEETVFRVVTAMSNDEGSRLTLIRIGGCKVLVSKRLCHSQGDFSLSSLGVKRMLF